MPSAGGRQPPARVEQRPRGVSARTASRGPGRCGGIRRVHARDEVASAAGPRHRPGLVVAHEIRAGRLCATASRESGRCFVCGVSLSPNIASAAEDELVLPVEATIATALFAGIAKVCEPLVHSVEEPLTVQSVPAELSSIASRKARCAPDPRVGGPIHLSLPPTDSRTVTSEAVARKVLAPRIGAVRRGGPSTRASRREGGARRGPHRARHRRGGDRAPAPA